MIDTRTVVISYALTDAICAIVIAYLWLDHRKRFAGIGFWLASLLMQCAGMLLFSMRVITPDFLSVVVGNTLVIAGILTLYQGMEHFLDQRTSQIQNYLLLAGFAFIHSYFTYAQPSLLARNINVSLVIFLICFQGAWLMFRRVNPEMRHITWSIGIVIVGFCLTALIRILGVLFIDPGSDYLQLGLVDTAVILSQQILTIALTFSLFLMVNRRLLLDLKGDLVKRKHVEEALRISEEKFFKAFHSSPDAILISRLKDGQLTEVNEGFTRLTGFSRQEALARSAFDLGLWANSLDREKTIARLQKNLKVREQTLTFRVKSGKTKTGLYSGEIIYLDDEPYIFSVVRDISEQTQKDDLTRLRLELWEYAAKHSLDELMQRALDEIGALTDSPIGFYHFVEEDQKTLSLQAWSTRTLAEFCRAQGKGLHYAIDKAGVWVDAFHQRKAVIHNDYAALPNRKGLPEGHAEIVRELVVPVISEGQVVSILGVGNKAYDYDEKDIDLVSYIADIVWTIVERKRAEEQIHQLNTRLERLAMTDDLTGVLNRRSFFQRGTEEIKRFARYQTPFSLLVLDIDHFKNINDSFGHDAGDRALKCFVELVQRNIRDTDILARLGGDEFGIVLPNIEVTNADIAAEKLRQAVEAHPCTISDDHVTDITISIGIAAATPKTQYFDSILKNADTALYQAKNSGRNRSVRYRT